MKHLLFFVLLLAGCSNLFAQKKQLDHADVHRWRKIDQPRISNDGQWVAYSLAPITEGDPVVELWNSRTRQTVRFARATDARITEDNKTLVFRIKPPLDTLKAQRRRKVKDDDLPKDTLAIYTLSNGQLEKIPRLKSFSLPEKWAGWLTFQLETEKPPAAKKDTSATKPKPAAADSTAAKPAPKKAPKKPKKEDKDNGTRLYVRNLATGKQDTFAYVLSYSLAKKQPRLLFNSTGKGDTLTFAADKNSLQPGIYWVDLAAGQAARPLYRGKAKYQQLSLSDDGSRAAFLADTDTTKARIRPWQLLAWSAAAKDTARILVNAAAPGITTANLVSENAKPVFSEDNSKLYFGLALPPVLNDTTLLPEEIVNVEVWNWTEKRIYTEQKNRLEADKKRSFTAVYHLDNNKLAPVSTPEVPEVRMQESRNANQALAFTEEPYAQLRTSEGTAHKDLYLVDLSTGARTQVLRDLRCNPTLSPATKYIAWWSDPDTAWFAWNTQAKSVRRLTDNRAAAFYDVENDVPDYPGEYGLGGWLDNDEGMLVYDQYDIWLVDPAGQKAAKRLTKGAEAHITYRYIRLDPEERSINPKAKLLLHQFDNKTKAEGYAWLDLGSGKLTSWIGSAHAYARQPLKARDAASIVYTLENFQTYPDLQFITPESTTPVRISNANPQQSEYRWGTIEPIHWTASSGEVLDGLLVKPEGFDPAKQYPMLVTFYERQSDELYRHRTPDFHRSTINATFYASRGYLVFIPDIHYRTGYPGECAYDAVISGVTYLIEKGFVNRAKIGMQGHSWGGYQSAYLVTRTNIFACAEAGAPVANMTSAYGGIRWESGLSRSFQYEHQQSRIGGTLWEYPMRYIENSPLFALDKVNTPVLILHNDKDGAVPWYQGIELYNGLRRLGKPSWLLNYNDEPHWPVKLQNRVDFQKRMQQFFDHYLLDAPEPRWMQRGVPPMEKGIQQGLETGN